MSVILMQNIAIILAGGSGRRAGGSIPKQFQKIGEKTILEHSIEKFESSLCIDEITLVVHPVWQETCKNIVNAGNFKKIRHIATGGSERYNSVLAALELYKTEDCRVLIHDAVRPAVSMRIIQEVAESLNDYRAVNVAIPATDTIIQTDPTHTFITAIPERQYLYQVQTPQGFHLPLLRNAYNKALQDPNFITTDDCSVIKKYFPQEKIKIVKGEPGNIKFTYAEDLILLEQFLK